MKAASKRSTKKSNYSPTSVQIEQAEVAVNRALGVALLLTEYAGGDHHNANAAGAIVEQLQKAQRLLQGEEARRG